MGSGSVDVTFGTQLRQHYPWCGKGVPVIVAMGVGCSGIGLQHIENNVVRVVVGLGVGVLGAGRAIRILGADSPCRKFTIVDSVNSVAGVAIGSIRGRWWTRRLAASFCGRMR